MSLTRESNLSRNDILDRLGLSADFGCERLFELRAAYRKKNGDNWFLCSALISEISEQGEELSQEYSECAFYIRYRKFSSLGSLLLELSKIGLSVSPSRPNIKLLNSNYWQETVIPSSFSPVNCPIRHLAYSIGTYSFADAPLVGRSLPYYSSFKERLRSFIEYEKNDNNSIHVLIRDPRAALKLNDGKVMLHASFPVSLVGVLEGNTTQRIELHDAQDHELDISGYKSVELWVVGDNNLIHDYISSSEYPYRYDATVEKTKEEYIKEKIDNGESLDCEFKKFIDVSNSKAVEIEKTVCAFSNAIGGEFIIGVSDDGDIVGVAEEVRKKYKADLSEAVSQYINDIKKRLYENITYNNCFAVFPVEICGKQLVVVSVNKANRWNFLQSSGLPFKRIGSTNVNAVRLVAVEYEGRNRDVDSTFLISSE